MSARVLWTAVLAAVTGAAVVAGCASARPATTATGAAPRTTSASATASAQPTVTCPGSPIAGARALTLRTTDGVSLAAYEAGTGDRGVVLVNELGALDLCGWWDYAPTLVRHGFRVLMFNHRCTTGSDCPAADAGGGTDTNGLMTDIEAATDRLESDGATHIALLGGSQGAAESLIFAAGPHPGVDAAVALSADELTDPLAAAPYPPTATAAAKQLRLPTLLAVADQDPYVTVPDTRALYASIPDPARQLAVISGSAHGWLLLDPTPSGARSSASTTVLAFLAKYVH